MGRGRSEDVRRRWRARLAEQAASGQSVAAFCRERGLCAPSLFAWKRRLLEEAAETPAFIELARPGLAEGFELRLAGGCSVWLQRGFDPVLLREVVAALEPRA